jgi:hypothetical protein
MLQAVDLSILDGMVLSVGIASKLITKEWLQCGVGGPDMI